MTTAEEILEERTKTHGDFSEGAEDFAMLMRPLVNKWLAGRISNVTFYGLTMSNSKQVRILNGDPNHIDHYIDGGNYFTLAGGLYRPNHKHLKVVKGGILLCGGRGHE
jgi:hypothetical protein|nr:MAG TPA: hypothetical protein [Caudoviricetes sp.]